MTERRLINETIGYLNHFKEDAAAGLPCEPDTIQMVIDRLQALLCGSPTVVMAEPLPIRIAADFRGEPPALSRISQSQRSS